MADIQVEELKKKSITGWTQKYVIPSLGRGETEKSKRLGVWGGGGVRTTPELKHSAVKVTQIQSKNLATPAQAVADQMNLRAHQAEVETLK